MKGTMNMMAYYSKRTMA